MRVRVVRRIDAQILWPHILLRTPRELQCVLNRGIALQRCRRDAGDCRTLQRPAGALRAGASRAPRETRASQLVSASGRRESWWCPRDSIRSTRRENATMRFRHLYARGVALEFVRRRKQKSLERFCVRGDIGNRSRGRAPRPESFRDGKHPGGRARRRCQTSSSLPEWSRSAEKFCPARFSRKLACELSGWSN